MKNFKMLLLAFTLMFSISAIAAPTSDKASKAKKEHKTTAEKKDKKFASVTYYYTPGFGGVTNAANWSTTLQSCPAGSAVLCSITFDDGTYPLSGGKPNSEVLTAVSSGTTGTSGTVYGASHTNQIPANAINYVNRSN